MSVGKTRAHAFSIVRRHSNPINSEDVCRDEEKGRLRLGLLLGVRDLEARECHASCTPGERFRKSRPTRRFNRWRASSGRAKTISKNSSTLKTAKAPSP